MLSCRRAEYSDDDDDDVYSADKNDCDPNPCRNYGRCIDYIGEFQCQCVGGWKGKTCILREY